MLAMANGFFREAVLLPNLSRPLAFALSGVLLSSLILAVAIALARWLNLDTTRRCLSVGLLWLGLTLAFEFGFGALQGDSLSGMLEAYAFRGGNIWPLVLAVALLAPLVAARVRPGAKANLK